MAPLEDEMTSTNYYIAKHGPAKNDIRPLLNSWFDEARKYLKSLKDSIATAKPQEMYTLAGLIEKSGSELIGLYNRRVRPYRTSTIRDFYFHTAKKTNNYDWRANNSWYKNATRCHCQ